MLCLAMQDLCLSCIHFCLIAEDLGPEKVSGLSPRHPERPPASQRATDDLRDGKDSSLRSEGPDVRGSVHFFIPFCPTPGDQSRPVSYASIPEMAVCGDGSK